MRIFPLCLALVGCGPGPDGTRKPKPDLSGLANECDPVVQAARPLLDSGPEGLVEPHSETFGSAPEPFHLHLGWPSSDPSTAISFVWRTGLDTLATAVELTPQGGATEVHEGGSFLYGGANAGEGPQRVHEIKLCSGLEPGTTYTYRVGGEGNWSPEYTFSTPEPPGSFDSFRVGVLGDSRGTFEAYAELLQLLVAHDPDFIVFGGDMVDLGPSQADWDGWFDAAGELLAETVVVPAHGNHEFLAVHYFAQFSLPYNEEWYSIRYGDLHMVSLNDTVRDQAERSEHQVAYMDAVFTEHDSDWQMAIHHQAIYSTSDRHGSDTDLRAHWEPVFDRYGVDLVIAGHNHLYERSVPIRGGLASSPEEGATYVVSGGAGAPLYTGIVPEWFGLVADPVEHYMVLDFGPGGIDVTARDRSENAIDQFAIPRR